MAYTCRICGSNEVDNPGDVCELCAIGADPYAAGLNATQTPQSNNGMSQQIGSGYAPKHGKNRRVLLNGGTAIANTDLYGNDMTAAQTDSTVQVYAAGQVPQQVVSQPVVSHTPVNLGNQPTTTGITKNITVDTQKKSVLEKWCRALFCSIPYTLDDDVTMFQVFPDYTGTSINAMGNACDQVIVYGRLNNGSVSENNDVEVYGRRDSHNNIIAKTIKNKASGTVIKPQRTISVGILWMITLILAALLFGMISALGVVGIVWAIVIVLCFTNLPLVVKVIGAIIGAIFSIVKSITK